MLASPDPVDYRFLAFLTDMLVCSGCLREGVRRPVRQVISRRHQPRSLCPACLDRRRTR